jgi:hypothetical protein
MHGGNYTLKDTSKIENGGRSQKLLTIIMPIVSFGGQTNLELSSTIHTKPNLDQRAFNLQICSILCSSM